MRRLLPHELLRIGFGNEKCAQLLGDLGPKRRRRLLGVEEALEDVRPHFSINMPTEKRANAFAATLLVRARNKPRHDAIQLFAALRALDDFKRLEEEQTADDVEKAEICAFVLDLQQERLLVEQNKNFTNHVDGARMLTQLYYRRFDLIVERLRSVDPRMRRDFHLIDKV